jgi:hypothetical protein
MQTATLSPAAASLFKNLGVNSTVTGTGAALQHTAHNTPSTETADRFELQGDQTSLLQYQSYSEHTTLAALFRQAAARSAENATDEGASAEVRQLEFEFFHEVRAEQLTLFQQRTAAVSDQLQDSQRSTYLETSQAVAARFSASVNVSVSVLQGYAGASESGAGAGSDVMDRLMQFTNDLLTRVDDVLNEAFRLLDEMMGTESGTDLALQLQESMDRLQAFLQDFFGGAAGTPSTGANQGTQQISMFGMQLEFSFSMEVEVSMEGAVQQSDPITLDLDGDGIELTNHAQGARFDILGSGAKATTAFVTGGDAFLAMDHNRNGRVDSGLELFGDQRGAANGFEELRKLDSTGDGIIDAQDKDFSRLLLFRDNGNGATEDGELISLASAGIASIDLGYRNVSEITTGGNRIAQTAAYRRNDGSTGRAVDAVLNYTA